MTGYRTIQYSIESHDRFRYEDFVTGSDAPKILTEDERRELAGIRGLFPEASDHAWLGPIPSWPP